MGGLFHLTVHASWTSRLFLNFTATSRPLVTCRPETLHAPAKKLPGTADSPTPFVSRIDHSSTNLPMEASPMALCEVHHLAPQRGVRAIRPSFYRSRCRSPRQGSLKLGPRRSSSVIALSSASVGDSYASSTLDRGEAESDKTGSSASSSSSASASPVYVPTPPNRELRTPHSG